MIHTTQILPTTMPTTTVKSVVAPIWLRFGPPLVGAPPCDYSEVSTSTPSLSYVAVTHAAP